MRHFDLTPLYRSTIGFDRLGSLLDTLTSFEGEAPSYPPYNIERVGENSLASHGRRRLGAAISIEVKEKPCQSRRERPSGGPTSAIAASIAQLATVPARRPRRGKERGSERL